jgi:hypothetical protein
VSGGAFRGRTAAVLAGVVALSLGATMLLSVFGPELSEPPSYGADGFSRSALGHRAFLEVLRRAGRNVILSRSRTAEKAKGGAVTALLEPALGPATPPLPAEDGGAPPGEKDGKQGKGAPKETSRWAAHLADIREAAPRLLVVLPKRDGTPEALRPRWVGAVQYLPLASAQGVLDALDLEATVYRPAARPGRWTGRLPAPELDDPQLLRSKALRPLLATPEGMLVGELVTEGHQLVVVSDPDVLQTHGLGRGRNAELLLALLDRMGGEKTLIVDETLHGYEIEPSLVQELLRFPLVLATLQAAAALLLLGWAAAVRFGRPVREPPLLRAGGEFLVENVAELLRAGGHAGEAARAYLRAAREEVLARVPPPPGGAEAPQAWLLRLEAARGREGTLRSLERQVAALADELEGRRRSRHPLWGPLGGGKRGTEVEAIRAARRIQRWREELTHGAAGNPREGRGGPG